MPVVQNIRKRFLPQSSENPKIIIITRLKFKRYFRKKYLEKILEKILEKKLSNIIY